MSTTVHQNLHLLDPILLLKTQKDLGVNFLHVNFFFFKLQFGKHNVVQRSLVAYSSWGNNESDMTATFTSLFFPSLYIQVL